VITSTNPKRTARDLRTRPERYELIGKPYDLDDVIAAVQRAVKKNANLESIRAKGDHRIDT
jgi:DNA-binding NtrC family response regulator